MSTPITHILGSLPPLSLLQAAATDAHDLTSSVSTTTLLYKGYGKDFIKQQGLSPDATVQMAFQRAYAQASGCVGSTYESASTKHFHHGRTETIRSVSAESVAFSRADAAGPAAADSLRKAVAKHVQRAKLCKDGLGIDRHLYVGTVQHGGVCGVLDAQRGKWWTQPSTIAAAYT